MGSFGRLQRVIYFYSVMVKTLADGGADSDEDSHELSEAPKNLQPVYDSRKELNG